MDNQMLISMMGSSVSTQTKSSSSNSTNASAFSQALEEATAGSSASSEQSQEIIAEKNTPKAEADRRKAEASDAQAQAKAAQGKMAQDPKAMGSRAYLYQLMYKNPDAMSLAERQSLKLDSASSSGVGLRELQTMLNERGVNMRDLSFTQLANLTKSSSRANVNQFLDTLIQEQQKGEGKQETATQKAAATTDAGQAASASKAEGKQPTPDNNLVAEAIRQANQAAPTPQAARTQKRQEVINQIVNHMEMRNLANRDELHLKLNPEYLGELKIKLTQGENGEVSARFITTSDETREVLADSKADLRKRVEEKGIRFGAIEVDLVDELV